MRRKAYVLVLVLAVLAMAQRPAYAMTATIPWGDLSGDFAYCAGKHTDAYSAAAELAGYDLSSLTREQRTALLDVNGDYVAYGQLAERLSTLSQVAEDLGGAVTSFFNVGGWLDMMGLDEIWVYRAANDDLIEQAALDIQECIAEHPRTTGNPDSGGGGSGGSGELPTFYSTDNMTKVKLGSFDALASSIEITLSGNYLTRANTLHEQHEYTACYFEQRCSSPSDGYARFEILFSDTPITYYQSTGDVNRGNLRSQSSIYYLTSRAVSQKTGTIVLDGTSPYTTGTTNVNANTGYATISIASSNQFIGWFSFIEDTPTYTPTLPQYPDNDIPDPTNITLPDITLPNITLPNLTLPTIQPSNPTYNTYTYNTYQRPTGTDYIPYLNNIIDWLSEIDLDLVSGLNALGDIMDGVNTQIRQQVKWLFDSLDVELDAGVTAINTTIRNMVEGLVRAMNDAFDDTFYDLKVWLKDALTKIKDEITDFDDDMLYELKLIRRKMGGGRSSEPSAKDNPDDWLKWWSDLIADLLGKLADALPDELLELVEDFKALGQKFPFSIPWDIAYLVGLFAHSPVTPVFDYPVPYGYANGEVLIASVHVDLSPWDGVALAIRNTQLVGFAIWLAFNTSKLSLYLKLPGSKGD